MTGGLLRGTGPGLGPLADRFTPDEAPDRLREPLVAIIRDQVDGTFSLQFADPIPAPPAVVPTDAGRRLLGPPDGTDGERSEFARVIYSTEQLGTVLREADWIIAPNVAADSDDPDGDPTPSLTGNPLWEALPAVRASRVLKPEFPVAFGQHHAAAILYLRELIATIGA